MADGNDLVDAFTPNIPLYKDMRSVPPTVPIVESVDIKESIPRGNVAKVCTSCYMVWMPSRRLLTGALKLVCS